LLTDAASVVNADISLVYRLAYGSGIVYQRKQSGNCPEYFVLGVPVYRARFRLPCSQKTAERFFRDIRRVLAHHEHVQDPLSGELEMDESPFGGARYGKRGWGAAGKILVFGIMKRNGKVRLSVVPNRKYKTLREEIYDHTKTGSLYYTDDYGAYASLPLRGDHVVVKKEKEKPTGRDHINGCRRVLELRETLAVSISRCAPKVFPSILR
jgi:transposase-like protein